MPLLFGVIDPGKQLRVAAFASRSLEQGIAAVSRHRVLGRGGLLSAGGWLLCPHLPRVDTSQSEMGSADVRAVLQSPHR